MRTDAENTEILRKVFETVGSDTEDNRALRESLSFKKGKAFVGDRSLSDVLWEIEGRQAEPHDERALRAAVLLAVELEDWLLGKKSASRRG